MNSQEQRLIEDLFNRLKSVSTTEKDEDAARYIRDLVARFPDAPYYLTQTVLVQQQALDRADARLKELEQLGRQARPGEQGGTTSFLGGSSVPQAGRREADAPGPAERRDQGPWAQPAPGRSGGFLSSALSTASGVAGGMFLADSIRNLFGGGGGGIFGSGSASAAGNQAALDKAQDETQDAEDDAGQARQDLAADDAALDDMQDEQDGDWSDDDGSLDV